MGSRNRKGPPRRVGRGNNGEHFPRIPRDKKPSDPPTKKHNESDVSSSRGRDKKD